MQGSKLCIAYLFFFKIEYSYVVSCCFEVKTAWQKYVELKMLGTTNIFIVVDFMILVKFSQSNLGYNNLKFLYLNK